MQNQLLINGQIKLTHTSYKAALAAMKKDKSGRLVTWTDAGEGWLCKMYHRFGRIVQVSINPDGLHIV